MLRKKYSGHCNLGQENQVETGHVWGPEMTFLGLYLKGAWGLCNLMGIFRVIYGKY
jgi:hypothetical protein